MCEAMSIGESSKFTTCSMILQVENSELSQMLLQVVNFELSPMLIATVYAYKIFRITRLNG